MTLHHFIVAALLATQAPPPPAEPPETAAQAAARAWTDSLQAQMRASKSPRERALAARGQEPRVGGKALRAAAKAAPTDTLAQMLWTTVGPLWSGCDASGRCAEQDMAWARAEPDNGFAWMAPFEASAKSADEESIDAGIARIAGAKHFDDHVVEFWRAYRRAIAARPMPVAVVEAARGPNGSSASTQAARQEAEGIVAMGYAAALPMQMHSLMRACKRADHPQASSGRFEDCARIGRGIVQSDSAVITKRLGSALVRVSGLETDADRQARRALDWRQHSAAKAIEERNDGAYFSDLDSTGSEVRAQELAMARAGIPLDPPVDWKP